MKKISYASSAANALRRHRADANRIMRKIERYASTGAGDVKRLANSSASRLRIGDDRAIFEETEATIIVTHIGPRSSIYSWGSGP
jgi:mRNA interferase RelE/StbE